VTAWTGEEAEEDEAGGCVEALPEADTGVWLGDGGKDGVLPGDGLGTLTWISGDWRNGK